MFLTKNDIEIWLQITLNLWIVLGSMDFVVVLSL